VSKGRDREVLGALVIEVPRGLEAERDRRALSLSLCVFLLSQTLGDVQEEQCVREEIVFSGMGDLCSSELTTS
jgi:hypothetical protein